MISEQVVKIGDIEVNFTTHEVVKNEKHIDLTWTEYKLLCLLVLSQGSVLERQKIKNQVWGEGVCCADNTINVSIKRLRDKLDSQHPNKYIQTINGIGYRWV